jgi:hypothetical protein
MLDSSELACAGYKTMSKERYGELMFDRIVPISGVNVEFNFLRSNFRVKLHRSIVQARIATAVKRPWQFCQSG